MKECRCRYCSEACNHKPGWFKPGEAEKVADHLGLSLEDLFKTKLGVDWWEGSGEDIFLLTPALSNMTPGEEYPGDPRGSCVFFEDGLCSIHSVKPFECGEYMHGDSHGEISSRHRSVADLWRDHQDQIETLLGREPQSSSFGGDGLFGLLGW